MTVSNTHDPARESHPSPGPRVVWLLEDSALEAQVAVQALAPGYEVLTFDDGSTMLERLAQETSPDALVLDWTLPGISGLEVLRHVRQTRNEVTLPVLILTATRSDSPDLLQALAARANDFVTKPCGAAELRARLGTLVRVKQLHDRARSAERSLTEALAREAVARAATDAAAQRLRLVMDALPVQVSFVTADGRYGLVNKAYEDWFGVAHEALVGRAVREVVGEAAYDVLGPYVRRVLAGERFDFEQHGVPYRLGGRRDVRVSFIPHAGREGSVDGYIALLQDVTEQRRATAAVKQQADFEQQLIGIVSHDLRNPLNVILGSSQLLLRSDTLSERATKSVVRIQNAADRAARMVRDLLDFTRARLGGGLRIEPRAADLHAIVRGVVDELTVTSPGREIAVRLEGDGQGAWDPDRLGQVVQNLVTNALAYSPDDSTVQVLTRGEPDAVVLAVHNSGAPIAPEKLPTLFEPFQRAATHVDAASRSVGLGLYIVDEIVRTHGGAIDVRSTEAAGTTFTVTLPRIAHAPDA